MDSSDDKQKVFSNTRQMYPKRMNLASERIARRERDSVLIRDYITGLRGTRTKYRASMDISN